MLADSSPRLNAAYHALHRLLAPRHPPYALNSSARMFLTHTPSRQDRCTILDVLCHTSSIFKVLLGTRPGQLANKNGLAPARPFASRERLQFRNRDTASLCDRFSGESPNAKKGELCNCTRFHPSLQERRGISRMTKRFNDFLLSAIPVPPAGPQ